MQPLIITQGRGQAHIMGKTVCLYMQDNKRKPFRKCRSGEADMLKAEECYRVAFTWVRKGFIDITKGH